MTTKHSDGQQELRRFLSADCGEREFRWPTCHPSHPTGFCPCDHGLFSRLWFHLKAGLLIGVMMAPFNAPKRALLRALGARIGRHVYISYGAFIDPIFPQLLTIEDEVMIGMEARILTHEFGPDYFRAGRVTIRRGAVIGGYALIGPGVEVGEDAVVAAGAVVGREVPAGHAAVGNPARCVLRGAAGAGELHDA